VLLLLEEPFLSPLALFLPHVLRKPLSEGWTQSLPMQRMTTLLCASVLSLSRHTAPH
jgi:hypothetical protein